MNWFMKEHPIQLTLKTFTVLVGKAPTKSKRIRMGFTLDLTAGDIKGMPEWMMDARDFVMAHGQTVSDPLLASGLNVIFEDHQHLFNLEPVKASKCDLRKFVVYSAGDADDPDTLLNFIMYTQFSPELNEWCGQMAGEAFEGTFVGAVPEPGDIVLKAADADEEEEDDDSDDEDEEEEDELEAQARRAGERTTSMPTPAAVAKARKNLEVM